MGGGGGQCLGTEFHGAWGMELSGAWVGACRGGGVHFMGKILFFGLVPKFPPPQNFLRNPGHFLVPGSVANIHFLKGGTGALAGFWCVHSALPYCRPNGSVCDR